MRENSKQKMKIGEFSRLGRVTVRTLRHYEQIGLLVPEIVDDWTGYRYYSYGQLQKLLSIVQLKNLGFTLAEIRDLYDDSTHYPDIRALERKIAACERELIQLRKRYDQLSRLLDSQKKKQTMEQFYVESLPSIMVASSRFVIPDYDALGQHLVEVVGPEMARLGCECPEPGYCFTIETANEYRAHDIEVEYCEKVAALGKDSAIIQFKTLSEVPEAVCMKVYGPYDRLYQSYLDVFAYIATQGYELCGHPRAVYVDGVWNEENPEKWLTIIQAPVHRK